MMSLPELPPISPLGEPPRSGWRRPALAGALVVVLAAFAGGSIAHFAWPNNSPSSVTPGSAGRDVFPSPSENGSAVTPSGSAAAASNSTDSIAAAVSPGLVDINVTTAEVGIGAGTGMVVTSNGEVITNNHVISGATRITATDVGNGKTYTARVVGYDKSQDIAVLMLEGASGLKTVPLGDSSAVRVGASVVTIGNAGGVGGTPSAAAGSVAALNQSITASDNSPSASERLQGLIEVNGQLEPGDSGGPLVDASGKVVGMDTAASSSLNFQSSSGNGFAIPINEVLSISRQIVAGTGSSTIHIGPNGGAFIGVLVVPVVQQGQLGGATPRAGAYVADALSGTPAARAGLSQGDTITSLGGRTVSSAASLTALMGKHHPGDHVRLGWLDTNGNAHTATLRLAAAPPA
jgi:S1-C subfamily serine protease